MRSRRHARRARAAPGEASAWAPCCVAAVSPSRPFHRRNSKRASQSQLAHIASTYGLTGDPSRPCRPARRLLIRSLAAHTRPHLHEFRHTQCTCDMSHEIDSLRNTQTLIENTSSRGTTQVCRWLRVGGPHDGRDTRPSPADCLSHLSSTLASAFAHRPATLLTSPPA